jgi:hypothetical protein
MSMICIKPNRWDYADSNYIGAIEQLASLKQVGNLGLGNLGLQYMRVYI